MISSNLDPVHPHLPRTPKRHSEWKTTTAQCGMQLMSLKVRQHLLWASTRQTDRYGQKIHSHWKQAASHRCCWQMTVAGHRQTRQEERRAPALYLIERTKAFRQRAREFSWSSWKPERATWRDSAAKRAPPHAITSAWNQPTFMQHFVNEGGVLANARRQRMPACLPHPLTPF